jgi:hypothetical protein
VKRYLFNILISLDQLLNTLLAGNPDETISSRVGKLAREKQYIWAANTLDYIFGYNHCNNSIETTTNHTITK